MSLTAIGFWLLYVAGVGGALLMPLAGVLLYVLIYHINPEYQWWGESIRAVGLRTSMTVAAATVIGILLRWPRLHAGARQFPLPICIAIAILVLALASLTWGYGPSHRGMYQVEKFAKILIFVLILIRCVREPQHYHLVIVAWICGLAYIGYQAWGNVGGFAGGRLTRGIGGPDFADSSGLAVHLVASLPLIGAMFFMARRWWSRALLLLVGALSVNTIIMTRTRNAIAGLAAMSLVAVLSLPRGHRRKGLLAIGVGTLLAVQLTDPHWWNRMATVFRYSEDPAAVKRLEYWSAAVRMVGEHPLGIGVGNFHEVVKEYVPGLQIVRSAHSSYFVCLAELGYLGIALLIILLAVTLRRLNRVRREANRAIPEVIVDFGPRRARFHLGWHAMALEASLVGYAAGGIFTTRLWTEGFWILLGLSCCLVHVALKIKQDEGLLDRHAAPSLSSGALPSYGVAPPSVLGEPS
jgi:probable O-glycosylation ligase (exosortase A-associated)